MIYYRFFVSLALGIASLGWIASLGIARESASIVWDDRTWFVVAQNDASQPTADTKPIPSNYDYLQAGNRAEASGNYQQAVEYYQQALRLNPEDPQLKILLRNVTGYAFDTYMQAGYVADRRRNYNEALNNFRQALELKPDSFHAKQAIRNVTNYLALNSESEPVVSRSEESKSTSSDRIDNAQWVESNKAWFLWGMGITSVAIAIILYNLFRSDKLVVTAESESLEPETPNFAVSNPEAIAATPKTPPQPKPVPPVSTPAVAPEIIADSLAAKKQDFVSISEPATVSVTSRLNNRLSKPKNRTDTPESPDKVTIVTSQTTKIDLVFELIKDLQQGDREVRRKVIWELAQKSDSRGISPLIEMMPHVDSLERNLILEAITQITSRTLQPMNRVLLESLEDDNPQVRKNAIRDLTRLYHLMSKVTKRLSQMTEDADLDVRQTARWALQELDRLPAAKQTIKGD